MIWQRLRYGTLVIAGVAVTGATIYLSARRTTAAVDLIELTEGLEERYRAVRAQSPTTFLVSTQQVDAWGINTNGWTYFVPNGTNIPSSTNYLSWTGTVSLVTTSEYTALAYSNAVRVQVGRSVWTGWTNLTAAGFSSGNGTYEYAGAIDGVDYYRILGTNNRAMLDYGPGSIGWEIRSALFVDDADPADWRLLGRTFWTRGHPNTFSAPWYSAAGSLSTGTVTAAGAPSYYGDRPAYVTEYQRMPITRTAPAQQLMTVYDAALLGLVTQYVDTVTASNGAVRYHSVTGLFARLAIGNGTNQFTRAPALGTNPATYGAVPLQMAAVHYTERYAILHALTQTVASTAWWTNSVGTNAVSSIPTNEAPISETYSFPVASATPGLPVLDGGTNVPSWWIYADDDGGGFSGAFWTNDVSQLYDGLPSGVVATNADGPDAPRVDYQIQYQHVRQQYFAIVDFGGYTLTHASRSFGGIDLEAYTSRSARVALPLRADLTGVTVRADVYAALQARTNSAVSTYFTTGAYYVAGSGTAAYSATGQVMATDLIAPPVFTFASTNLIAANWRKDYNDGGTLNFRARVDNATDNQALRYYGSMLQTGPVIVTWGFTRCTN